MEYNREFDAAHMENIERSNMETHLYRAWLTFNQWRIAYTLLNDDEKNAYIAKSPYYNFWRMSDQSKQFEKQTRKFKRSSLEYFFKDEYSEVDYMSAFTIFPQRDKIEQKYYQELKKRGFAIVKIQ